jgi:hypothetical protein
MRLNTGVFLIALAALYPASSTWSEDVWVKYRGSVDLEPFDCTDVNRSSFIKRVCFNKAKRYMLIRLNDTYYHYCNIPESAVTALMGADSMGRFFNAQVKGKYNCRLNPPPKY